MSDRSPVIAVLDDEARMRTALRRLLQMNGFRVELFENSATLLEALPETPFGCILLDLHMPEGSGFTILEKLTNSAAPPVIVITGNDQPGIAERVGQLGARSHLTKPVDEETLLLAIHSALLSGPGAPSSPCTN